MGNGIPKVLVPGATGQVGASVIPLLAAAPGVRAIAVVSSADEARHLGVPVRPLSVADISLGPYRASLAGEFVTVDPTLEHLRGHPPINLRDLLARKVSGR